VGGKPSEVSVYVLSTDALLDKFVFDKALQNLRQRRVEWGGLSFDSAFCAAVPFATKICAVGQTKG